MDYCQWRENKEKFKLLNLKLILKQISNNPSTESISQVFDIIPENSWIARNITNEQGSEKLHWFREFKLSPGIKLQKDFYKIMLSWKSDFYKNDSLCCYEKTIELTTMDYVR